MALLKYLKKSSLLPNPDGPVDMMSTNTGVE